MLIWRSILYTEELPIISIEARRRDVEELPAGLPIGVLTIPNNVSSTGTLAANICHVTKDR